MYTLISAIWGKSPFVSLPWKYLTMFDLLFPFFSGYSSTNTKWRLAPSDISTWDVSSVSNMAGMFYGALLFNSDISSWQVGTVTAMNVSILEIFCVLELLYFFHA